jgi:hypothetical protein
MATFGAIVDKSEIHDKPALARPVYYDAPIRPESVELSESDKIVRQAYDAYEEAYLAWSVACRDNATQDILDTIKRARDIAYSVAQTTLREEWGFSIP